MTEEVLYCHARDEFEVKHGIGSGNLGSIRKYGAVLFVATCYSVKSELFGGS